MSKTTPKANKTSSSSTHVDFALLERITERAIYYSTQMIHQANNRSDVEKGDPKVGGHPAASASCAHIMGALHLNVREPQDYFAIKPHASPMDHSYSHLMGLFEHTDGKEFSEAEAKKIMFNLRHFMNPEDPNAEPAFQSYHAVWDPDSFNYFPSGSVGIPPVAAAYTALAYRFAAHHGFEVPKDAHFWCLMGDSEFREGSLAECMPDAAERELGNLTWIVDYNRQNLDGTRIKNEEGIHGTDADRIERLGTANGWKVIQVRHGKKRMEFFQAVGGDIQKLVEHLSDFELQALLVRSDGSVFRKRLLELNSGIKAKLQKYSDADLLSILLDLGGHDISVLSSVFKECRKSKAPTLVIPHTIKGWGIHGLAAVTGNHSMLPSDEEVDRLREAQKVPKEDLFQLFEESTKAAQYLKARGEYLRTGRRAQKEMKERNLKLLEESVKSQGDFPKFFDINLKLSPWANTQWMWGQLAAKLIRVANTIGTEQEAALTPDEKRWILSAKHVVTMAPDVGTSTNLNPSMDGKVYAPDTIEDFEEKYQVKDKRRPDLVPLEKQANRHLRFEIEEGNAMSCVGAFGKMRDHLGIPLFPMMTVYDFFIKRALDQYFYNVYWKSSFILVGTPSGVTLSPEGAQHSWKSDLQIPNGITWEPAFSIEMDWILADAVHRHFTFTNKDREGVLIRAVTRGIEQKPMMENIRKQRRFQGISDPEIIEATRQDVLEGGYWLCHYDGEQGYAPGDNVVHLFVMGALVPEALKASDKLLEQGIYANVLVVSSPDLLIGTLGSKNDYQHLKQKLGVDGKLYLSAQRAVSRAHGTGQKLSHGEVLGLRGSRIPIVAICDGEPGLLDNIGSIVGVPQETLAVRKHSKSGRPVDVYKYHHLDPDSICETALKLFELAATEEIEVAKSALSLL